MNCRHCCAALEHVFLDLGLAPPSNALLSAAELEAPEVYFPLKLHVCTHCWLVQTEDYADPRALFDRDYAYFSSVSQSWLVHAERYVDMIRKRLRLGPQSLVLEVGANDGYLLRNFVVAGIPCLGIEPTASTATVAESLGIPIVREFFGAALAQRLAATRGKADLIIGNNVYAHVPDLNDFTRGLEIALKPGGTVTLEFPHLLRLIEQVQFDTVYHEHFSYFSLHAVARVFAAAGMRLYDVEELATHGGSLRVYACHVDAACPATAAVAALLSEEERYGLTRLPTYSGFQARADRVRDEFRSFLIEQERSGKRVAGYGAAAKGNTLLNYAGIKPDLLPYVCDAAPSKQGKFLPGSHIPVLPPAALQERRPEVVVILPWNIAAEVIAQHAYIRTWGGRFVTAGPNFNVEYA